MTEIRNSADCFFFCVFLKKCYNDSCFQEVICLAEILKLLVKLMAKVHNAIVRYCNVTFGGMSDKMLHFLIIGILGMGMIAIIYPMFRYLAKRKMIMAISWIYVFTLLVVITFGIEIGQKITNTGNMEFTDIVAGLTGFMCMFLIMMAIWGIVILIRKLIEKRSAY